ncbi:hypothetical protein DFJ74DRAFT_737347 [Hyaloraphidium curvatum]|nr:hypothetical protein DFJ74DRAFT_747852 [Hyaloraphidium curvatum]KAI9010053.1 hypothetical protein DFJ74DRAFT_737347 [Hyaloraphidium curvatum]
MSVSVADSRLHDDLQYCIFCSERAGGANWTLAWLSKLRSASQQHRRPSPLPLQARAMAAIAVAPRSGVSIVLPRIAEGAGLLPQAAAPAHVPSGALNEGFHAPAEAQEAARVIFPGAAPAVYHVQATADVATNVEVASEGAGNALVDVPAAAPRAPRAGRRVNLGAGLRDLAYEAVITVAAESSCNVLTRAPATVLAAPVSAGFGAVVMHSYASQLKDLTGNDIMRWTCTGAAIFGFAALGSTVVYYIFERPTYPGNPPRGRAAGIALQ